jgi:hypothetical protein
VKKLITLFAALMIALSPLTVAGQGINLGNDDEQEGMTDEEWRDFVYELIDQIIAQEKSEGPNVDTESDPRIVEYILSKLELQKVTVYFQETRFEDALDFLRDITGLNIVMSPHARDLTADVSINLRLRDIKLKSVLALMLESVDGLTYGVKYDVLYIGTVEDWADVGQWMVIYSIHEIVYRPPDFPAPKIGLGDIIPWQNK